ncbi:DgyrCDS8280 [Dimorphilus gyrociliatus]|uniref:DgyrCDS8280 n=1 Tax=Dimorphilus gyrociliatus TaxID=2664684 RepID=A0A7I8VTX5_9ANNE|nr:DgyrCDS8280 [Dimorphilus gyrociliatus]
MNSKSKFRIKRPNFNSLSAFGKTIRNLSINSRWFDNYYLEYRKSTLINYKCPKKTELDLKTDLKHLTTDPNTSMENISKIPNNKQSHLLSRSDYTETVRTNNNDLSQTCNLPIRQEFRTSPLNNPKSHSFFNNANISYESQSSSSAISKHCSEKEFGRMCTELLNTSLKETPKSKDRRTFVKTPSTATRNSWNRRDNTLDSDELQQEIENPACLSSSKRYDDDFLNTDESIMVVASSPNAMKTKCETKTSLNKFPRSLNFDSLDETSIKHRRCEVRLENLNEKQLQKYTVNYENSHDDSFQRKRESLSSPLFTSYRVRKNSGKLRKSSAAIKGVHAETMYRKVIEDDAMDTTSSEDESFNDENDKDKKRLTRRRHRKFSSIFKCCPHNCYESLEPSAQRNQFDIYYSKSPSEQIQHILKYLTLDEDNEPIFEIQENYFCNPFIANLFKVPLDWLERVIEKNNPCGEFTAKTWLESDEYEALQNFCYIKGIRSKNFPYLKKVFGGVSGLYASYCYFFQNNHNRKPKISKQAFYKTFLQYLSEKEVDIV